MKKRIRNSLFAAFVTAILFSFCAIPASAAEIETASAPAAVSEIADDSAMIAATPLLLSAPAPATITPHVYLAAAGGGAAPSGSGSATADSAYQSVINFFLVWIRRVGALVALIGGIMFGLAVKANDPDQKERGILTMVAGFIVFAIALGANMFDLFS